MVDPRLKISLRERIPELLLIALGAALRLSMVKTYDVRWGYDFDSHWKYVEWYRTHWGLPDLMWSRATYHPPLFYILAGIFLRLGWHQQSFAILPALSGLVKLIAVWLGLELTLPKHRPARLIALGLAAVLPAAVHMDGQVNCEALLGTFAAIGFILLPFAFSSPPHIRYRWATLTGATLGLGMLTKISTLTLIAGGGIAALLELATNPDGGWSGRWRRFAPLLIGLGMSVAVSGWYFARNHSLYGHTFISAFDAKDAGAMETIKTVPYFHRRPLSFIFGWSNDIYRDPEIPSGMSPKSYFAPVLIATTFSDYYRFRFAPPARHTPIGSRGPVKPLAVSLGSASVIGGTLIAVITLVAYVFSLLIAWRQREFGLLAVLLVPLLTLAGQLDIAIRYPIDFMGTLKGSYMQYANPPLCALFGIGIEWLWAKRWSGKILALTGMLGLAAVAMYTIYCRIDVSVLQG